MTQTPIRIDRSLVPYLLIGVGGVWLLIQLGILSGAMFVILFTFWPLLLIGAGLDYFMGYNQALNLPHTAIAALALGVLMLVGPSLGLARGGQVTNERYMTALENTRRADIRLNLSSAPTQISILTNSTNLIEADISDAGRIVYRASGNNDKSISLRREGRIFGVMANRHWRIGLNPAVPFALTIDGSSGANNMNLEGLTLSALSYDGGSGAANLTLAASSSPYSANISGGSGSINLHVPDRAQLELDLATGSGSSNITIGRDANVTLNMRTGSGASNITLPSNTPVRVEVRGSGSGRVNVGRLERVSGEGNTGVWQTAGYEAARGAKVAIVVGSRGSGSINVR